VIAACFINDVLDGTVQATKSFDVRNGQGKLLRIDYDDPDGASGAGRGGRSRETPPPRDGG
jgi:hypothetical protein